MASTCLLFLLVAIIPSAILLPYQSDLVVTQFKDFVKKHNKQYTNAIEEAFRFGIFLKSLDYIDHLNKHSKGTIFGVNQFTDLTDAEFHRWNTGLSQSSFGDGCLPGSVDDYIINVTDSRFDWRDNGVVGPVKNQGNCGSCWAFSTMGNVESVNGIKTRSLASLSEQQLVDCDTSSNGCTSGYLQNAFAYVVSNGAMYESDYPYTEHQGSCQYDQSKVSVKINTCYTYNLPEDALAQKLQQMGPLSIAVDATYVKHYHGGILQDASCQGTALNHAVLLVGFGEEGGVPYWIIKNSWGPGWGEAGYFRMKRGVNCCLLTNGPAVTAA